MSLQQIKISYPPGAGGNWLQNCILHGDLSWRPNDVNFHHNHKTFKPWHNIAVDMIHSIDPNEYTHLYSGSHYFNFFTNVLYKYWHHELDFFSQSNYQNALLTAVQTSRFICQFSSIKHHTFLDFDHLIYSPDDFYQQLCVFADTYQIPVVTLDDFENRRRYFLETMVDIDGLYENFDNMIWVCFVLGQLMEKNIVPQEFEISAKQNQSLCKRFAQDYYDNCDLRTIYRCKSNKTITDLLC